MITNLFMALASVVCVSIDIEPKLIAPDRKQLISN